ncbi:spore protease YyaC [Ammoniphilus sp. YIM 78166]|uniref:spore protease YyaC n=1 Tax=Ammoniphilus sp. YIM 78166 TaxID=1644106 RepID=UPI00106F5717|nr:spore protease YyaC [Ammoniphilus sp. YIM 78166]
MSLLYQVSYKNQQAVPLLGEHIRARLLQQAERSNLIILCIGTDRCTGDALGPLIGMNLERAQLSSPQIWGTLEKPVHALNLKKAIEKLSTQSKPTVIAVDACLGLPQHVGDVQIVDGPLRPGLGVRKVLPSVGDFHIKGIVNSNGFLDAMVLHNTRLHTVMEMAHVISEALIYAIGKKANS